MRCSMWKLAETSRIQCLPNILHWFVKSVLMISTNYHTGFFTGLYNRIRIHDRQSNRLFNDHVASCGNAVKRNRSMFTGFSCNRHKLRFLLFQHFLIICVTLYQCELKLIWFFLHCFRQNITHSNKVQMIILRCFNVIRADTSAPY